MKNNAKKINFEGMHVSEALEGLFIKPNQALVLTVEPKETNDELLITSSVYQKRADGNFSLEVIYSAGAEEKSETKTPADSAKLAHQISELLANPDCPVDFYNAIADELTDFSNHIDYHSPEMIEKSLAAWAKSESNSPKVPRDDAGFVIFQEREQ